MSLKLKVEFPKIMRIPLEKAYLDDLELIPGDDICVNEESDPEAIAKIDQLLFDCGNGKIIVKVQWYFKASDINDAKVKKVSSEIEIFLSDSFMEVELGCVDGKVKVLELKDIFNLDAIDDDVYFTRARWNSTTRKVVPPVESWEKHCVCKKIINPDLPFVVCSGCQMIFHEKCLNGKNIKNCTGCGEKL
jgi:hypothetical protein